MNINEAQALNKLIVNNNDFEMLNAKLNIFNPFKVLKIDSMEIRHSNIISWLLDPNGNHALGDKFLKKILSEIILISENTNFGKSPMEIYSGDFQDTQIYREWNHIDIMAVSEKNKTVLVIENKIYSTEHDDQLIRYLKIVNCKFKDYDIIPVYLTLEGSKATSSQDWTTFDYGSIYKILKNIINLYKDNLNDKIIDFINYYLKTLEDLTMQDEEIINLCKTIYSKNKEAIDLIIKYGKQSALLAAGEEFINRNKNILNVSGNSNLFEFIPKEFLGKVPEISGKYGTYDNYSIQFYFIKDSNKLSLNLEIAPFDDIEMRKGFIKYLKDNDLFTISDQALSQKNTKIFSKKEEINDWDDQNLILNVMEYLYNNKAKEATENIIKAINNFSWEFNTDKHTS